MKKNLLFVSFMAIFCHLATAQRYGVPEFKIVSDFTPDGVFTDGIEGPAVDKKGYLYVVNYQKEGTIGVVDYFGKASLYLTLPEGSVGNSIVIDTAKSMMYVADYTKHNIFKIDMNTKQINVLVHNDKFNQPNDMCRTKSGVFYVSDPNWETAQGNIWKVDTNGVATKLDNTMSIVNGIALSPDEKYLYVTEQSGDKVGAMYGQSADKSGERLLVWKFTIKADGSLGDKEQFFKFPDYGMDGMKVDKDGNLYITRYGKGTVAIVSEQGLIVREIKLYGSKPTNITFGGMDGRTCFVTLQDRGCVESFRMPKNLPKKKSSN